MRWTERLRADLARIFTRERVIAYAPSFVVVTAVIGMFVAVHLTFFAPAFPMNPKDEGYINAFAVRLLDGHGLPYVDAVSHRGPMLYWLMALADLTLGDRMTFVPIRRLAEACSILIVSLTFLAALRAKRPLAGAIAALGLAVALILEQIPDDGLAYNGETALDVLVLGALVCLTFALAPDRRRVDLRLVAAAGVLAAFGALTKQVAVVAVLALGLWPAAASIARDGERGWRQWKPLLVYLAAAAVPPAIVLARYAAAGELRTFFFYAVTYNSQYYMAPFTRGTILHDYVMWMQAHAALVTAGVLLAAVGVARAIAAGRREGWARAADRHGFLLVVSACAFLSAAVANGTLRNFPHYYVQAIPWFALLFGLVLEEILLDATSSPARRAWVHAAVLAPSLFVVGVMLKPVLEKYRANQAERSGSLPICAYVAAHTAPSDRIYVWGFAPDIYTFCHRKSASRYVYSTFQSGFVPFFDHATRADDQARIVPGSPAIFLRELDEAPAKLVMDVSFTMGRRKIDQYPDYAAYLATHYCAPIVYDGVRVWRRREGEGACAGDER